MDIDFHFGTIYVLSRWAGFGSSNAKIIATCSQFVDDNIADDPDFDDSLTKILGDLHTIALGKKVMEDGTVIRYSGHELWANFLGKDANEEVWIPYHFLPGLQGDSLEERLICKKNSMLANELGERLKELTFYDPDWAFKLGIGLHVYADTWAHREFAGVSSIKNLVEDLKIELFDQDNWVSLDSVGDMLANMALNFAAPLGHAAAITWPDCPYARWRSSAKFPNGRDNCEEFLEASKACFKVLTKVSGDYPDAELDEIQLDMLRDAFISIRGDEGKDRNEIWIEWIKNNVFGFDDNSGDQDLEYSKYLILSDEDFPKQFYNSLNEHYEWVKGRLEDNGIKILDC